MSAVDVVRTGAGIYRIRNTISNAHVEDHTTAAAATIYRMHTLANLPFATHFCFKHICFTSHLHWLTASCGINVYLFYFAVFILYGLKPGAHNVQIVYFLQNRKLAF